MTDKYFIHEDLMSKSELAQMLIANELAEANRLKVIELEMKIRWRDYM